MFERGFEILTVYWPACDQSYLPQLSLTHRLLAHSTLVCVPGWLVVVGVGNEASTHPEQREGLDLQVCCVSAGTRNQWKEEAVKPVLWMSSTHQEKLFLIFWINQVNRVALTCKSCAHKERSDSRSPRWRPGTPPGPRAESLQSFCRQEKCVSEMKKKIKMTTQTRPWQSAVWYLLSGNKYAFKKSSNKTSSLTCSPVTDLQCACFLPWVVPSSL